jgi:hypothetical protein
MQWIRALAPALVAGCAAAVSFSAVAQTAPAGARTKVDVRTMVPGPQASDAAAEPRPAGGLTRNQRKEAALQARQEGVLQPAGEAADPGASKPAPVAAAGAQPAPAACTEEDQPQEGARRVGTACLRLRICPRRR